MLTIRHIEVDGRERVFSASSIIRTEDGFTFGERITSGKVYVMNENGKTVAVYSFDKKQEQKHER